MNMKGVCVAFVGLAAVAGISYQVLKEKPASQAVEQSVSKKVDGGESSVVEAK